jgi:hypothetical protein
MAVSWCIKDGLVCLQSEGEWSRAEWRGAVDGFLADPEFRTGMGLIHDQRRLLLPERGLLEVRAAVDFLRPRTVRIGRARWAVLVGDPGAYGLARVAQAVLLNDTEISLRVFYDASQAEAWVRGTES